MSLAATLANTLWLASSLPPARRLARALREPGRWQAAGLRAMLARHAQSAFGREHDFAAIADPSTFSRRVPLADYERVAPYVERIRLGDADVLARSRVTHLAPTSGSTGARKLIPFTRELQRSFDSAVKPWIVDLARQRPALLGGPAYWSVSPLAEQPEEQRPTQREHVPVGFADDAEYLGGQSAWLVRQVLAAPASLRFVRDMPAFWALTLLSLLARRDLRLISVWHPSFVQLMVDEAPGLWPALLDAISQGDCPWSAALPPMAHQRWRLRPDPVRARELARIGPADWHRWWPRLQVVSCWGEQAAEAGWRTLATRLPGVLVQRKGLLATEGVVTIPLGAATPLAVTSHFFEFLDEGGDVHLAHQLHRGTRYEVVLTNGGGLWRYRLGDVVECTGFLHATPTLHFLGRAGTASDLRGEKLSEPFVAGVLAALWPEDDAPAYAALRAWHGASGAGYELLVSPDGTCSDAAQLAARVDEALGANPHFALARRLGQLRPTRVVVVGADYATQHLAAHPGRLGDAKPQVLLRASAPPT